MQQWLEVSQGGIDLDRTVYCKALVDPCFCPSFDSVFFFFLACFLSSFTRPSSKETMILFSLVLLTKPYCLLQHPHHVGPVLRHLSDIRSFPAPVFFVILYPGQSALALPSIKERPFASSLRAQYSEHSSLPSPSFAASTVAQYSISCVLLHLLSINRILHLVAAVGWLTHRLGGDNDVQLDQLYPLASFTIA